MAGPPNLVHGIDVIAQLESELDGLDRSLSGTPVSGPGLSPSQKPSPAAAISGVTP